MTVTANPIYGPLPPRTQPIDVHVGELKQLFNSIDAAPFRERDLDPKAERFIVDTCRELRANDPLALIVHLSREPVAPEEGVVLQEAIREYFAASARSTRKELRKLLRIGRVSLLIGVLFVGGAIALSDFVAELVGRYGYIRIVAESLVIGAWVALWRPIEIFLYDWWPIYAEARLLDRLSAMQVRVVDETPGGASSTRFLHSAAAD